MKSLKIIALCVLIAVSAIVSPLSARVHAADCDPDFFSDNDIIGYNPCAQSCSATPSPSVATGNEIKIVDYKNREIFNDTQFQMIKDNQPFYEEAAKKAGIPWEMIAVIHFRETGLKRVNPSNGQGIYQDYAKSRSYPAGEVDDAEFQAQTDWAANFLKGKAGSRAGDLMKEDESSDAAVKYAFFAYNGTAGAYITQAKSLGFSDEEAAVGEGSPYVMNKADEKRDPENNPDGWGQIKLDGGGIVYPANRDYGAYVMYAALKGKSASSCSSTLGEGGLTEEQAKQFVMNYGENKNNVSAEATGADLWNACLGGGANCVTFAYFFNHKFTDLPAKPNDGNGQDIVNSLRASGADGGSEPKVFSTFSWKKGAYGHVGIVLGIHGDQIITAHAACMLSSPGKGDGTSLSGAARIIVGTRDDQKTWGGGGEVATEFAYPKNVDSKAIEDFINN